MDTALTSSLSGMIVAGAYLLYKFIGKNKCKTKSKCTEAGLDLQISTVIEAQLESKKNEMLQLVIEKLNSKLESLPLEGVSLSPQQESAKAPTLNEDSKLNSI